MHTDTLTLSMQRKIIGGYINAEEVAQHYDASKILDYELQEEWFTLPFHRLVVRAINHIKSLGQAVSDISLLSILQRYGQIKNIKDEQEYNLLQSECFVTYNSFMTYVMMIKKNRIARVTL